MSKAQVAFRTLNFRGQTREFWDSILMQIRIQEYALLEELIQA